MNKRRYTELEQRNLERYLKAPTYEETVAFVKTLGVSLLQFERFYGLAPRTIGKMKSGERTLPIRAWHFVYEKIVPIYSVAYTKELSEPEEVKKPISIPKKPEPKKQIEISNHGRLQSLKNK